jgi:hypothetical protein
MKAATVFSHCVRSFAAAPHFTLQHSTEVLTLSSANELVNFATLSQNSTQVLKMAHFFAFLIAGIRDVLLNRKCDAISAPLLTLGDIMKKLIVAILAGMSLSVVAFANEPAAPAAAEGQPAAAETTTEMKTTEKVENKGKKSKKKKTEKKIEKTEEAAPASH